MLHFSDDADIVVVADGLSAAEVDDRCGSHENPVFKQGIENCNLILSRKRLAITRIVDKITGAMTKRIEFWILIALTLVTLLWLLNRSPEPKEDDSANGPEAPALLVKRSSVERDFGNARLDLELRIRHDGIQPLLLKPPTLRLLSGPDGLREVPLFFLPGEPLPQVSPRSTSVVTLRYWLDASDLDGPLWIDWDGKRTAVKSAAPFPLDQLKNRQIRTFTDINWSAK